MASLTSQGDQLGFGTPLVPLLGIILFTISGRGGFKAAGSEAQHAAQRAARARARAAVG